MRLIGIDDLKVAAGQTRSQTVVAERSEDPPETSKTGAELQPAAPEPNGIAAAYSIHRSRPGQHYRFSDSRIYITLFMNNSANSARIQLVQGDITRQPVAAIVNAANSSLLGGGGVDGAIHRAGGPRILEECRFLRERKYPFGLSPGQAVATTGGNLPAEFVIHTAGPVWHGGGQHEAEELAACYQSCLKIAMARQFKSVAFPGISTGIYGYPKPEAATVAVREVRQWLAAHAWPHTVVFVVFDEESRRLYERELASG